MMRPTSRTDGSRILCRIENFVPYHEGFSKLITARRMQQAVIRGTLICLEHLDRSVGGVAREERDVFGRDALFGLGTFPARHKRRDGRVDDLVQLA